MIETYSGTSGPTLFTSTAAASAVIKGSPGRLIGLSLYNTTASIRYLRLFNKASAPTLGTDVPVMIVAVGATSAANLFLTSAGRSFSLGIGYAVTTDAPLLAATVAATNDVLVSIDYA